MGPPRDWYRRVGDDSDAVLGTIRILRAQLDDALAAERRLQAENERLRTELTNLRESADQVHGAVEDLLQFDPGEAPEDLMVYLRARNFELSETLAAPGPPLREEGS